MLSDEQLQAIADEYVRSELLEWELWDIRANLAFATSNPPGAYFKPRIHNWVPELDDKATMDLTEPIEHGFFVYRGTGDKRIITGSDIGGARWSIDWGNDPKYWEVDIKPEHIRYILTGAIHPNSYDPSSGPPRLTSYELDIIASDYINSQTSLRSHQPAAECALDDPPGVFFMALNTGEFEVVDEAQPPDFPVVRVEPVDQDHIGFFVHGISGEVRLISYREIMAAGWKVTMGRPEEIKRILTRVLRPRPWWKFW